MSDELERTEIANRDHRAKMASRDPIVVAELTRDATQVVNVNTVHDMWTDFTRLARDD